MTGYGAPPQTRLRQLIARLRSFGGDRAFILEFLMARARLEAMAKRRDPRPPGGPSYQGS